MKSYILIPRLHIHNATALSSTITVGVPAMTAWLGAVHALERKVSAMEELSFIRLPKVAVSFHKAVLQVFENTDDHSKVIIGTRNPFVLTTNSKSSTLSASKRKVAPEALGKGVKAKPPSIIEEPRIDLQVSLLLEVQGLEGDNDKLLEQAVNRIIPCMKMAGGDIVGVPRVRLLYGEPEDHSIINSLMPGYTLIARTDLLKGNRQNAEDGLDNLLDFLKIHYTFAEKESAEGAKWIGSRKEPGWLVPVAVGFKGLSELGRIPYQRDQSVPHRFCENVVILGEFKLACRMNSADDMMWEYHVDPDENLYLCVNNAKGDN